MKEIVIYKALFQSQNGKFSNSWWLVFAITYDILAKTRSRMETITTFSCQNDAGSLPRTRITKDPVRSIDRILEYESSKVLYESFVLWFLDHLFQADF